ncbi:benzoate transporter [Lentzea tibetensis]|uniref:Benzoate transporter n=1 Tax=Lentzea tibetensis TaxID=2591470 RepID=A0A563EJ09_9PSEU|nr:beta-propeller domain-containing protein [Lentzea tibetensis]TWP46528.1 benzoate transporter [Lentzea tibetensis]
MTGRWVLAGTALAIVVGVTAANPFGDEQAPPQPIADTGPVRLIAFDSCDAALTELRRAALPHVTAYGFGGAPYMTAEADARVSAADSAGKAATPPMQAPQEHSSTNTHEQGVDEPDLVKTDGQRIVSITDGKLRVIDVKSKKVTGTLDFPAQATQLLMHGDRALVVSSGGYIYDRPGIAKPVPPDGQQFFDGTQLMLVDLAGPPRIMGTLKTEGVYVDARQTDGTARVVIRSTPRIPFIYPDGTIDELGAIRKNREILGSAPIDTWLPRYELELEGKKSSGTLVDCAKVSHPVIHTATSMLTVLSFDLPRELGTGQPVSIVADGDTVYGSGKNLYVADDHRLARQIMPQRPNIVPTPAVTAIHQFDTSKPGPPVHVASGEVKGTLLNQYALSEHDGHLRVATTTGNEFTCCWRADQPQSSQQALTQSSVTVLARQGNTLAETGRVDGLGKGERIRGVRFAGDIGYVVTFRQTDPLYTLDLKDPKQPKTVGELKITGYSAYLHPIGGGKLIGIGQEATDQGRATGTQVSLFDVSNLAAPRRLAQHHLPNSNSEAEFDPHAFLYWPANGMLVIPIMSFDRASTSGPVSGSLVLRVRDGAFTEVGTLQQRASGFDNGARRAIVIGDQLWTVSSIGASANAMDGLAEQAWIPFS